MGSGGSKHADVAAAIKAFGKDETEKIKNFYTGMEDGKVKKIDPDKFAAKYPRFGPLTPQILAAIPTVAAEPTSTSFFESYIVFMYQLLKGGKSDHQSIFFNVASLTKPALNRQDLTSVLDQLAPIAIQMDKDLGGKFPTIDEKPLNPIFVPSIVDHAFTGRESMNIDGVEGLLRRKLNHFKLWLSKLPVAGFVFDFGLRAYIIKEYHGGKIKDAKVLFPALPTPRKVFGVGSSKSALMDREGVWFLNAHLPRACCDEECLLFDSMTMGAAYNSMRKSTEMHGCTLVIVKDKDGYVFGGFASDEWHASSVWFGDSRCFLFTLYPKMAVYLSTGLNDHYQYLNQNQKTMPNGMGMGGQMEHYFGLWIASDFEHGHSKAHPLCSTFGSPRLSKEEEFLVDCMETWRVGPEPEREEVRDTTKGALANEEAKAFLEMAGKKLWTKEQGIKDNLVDEDEADLTQPVQH